MITASKPTSNSSQRGQPTRSLKSSAEAATNNKGTTDQVAVKLASGMLRMQKKPKAEVMQPSTAREYWKRGCAVRRAAKPWRGSTSAVVTSACTKSRTQSTISIGSSWPT